jgi:hypothetical protein
VEFLEIFMKKWMGLFFSVLFFLIGAFFSLKLSIPVLDIRTEPPSLKQAVSQGDQGNPRRVVFGSEEERGKREAKDTYYVQILRILREKLNEWLKSLNERIESEDITRLEVRFLEILRNILEWFKEKIDAKLGPPDTQKTEMRYRDPSPLRIGLS